MATTVFFEEAILHDKERKDIRLKLEFGRSSFYGENLMFLTVDDKQLILDEHTGRKIYEAMTTLGAYLRYDED